MILCNWNKLQAVLRRTTEKGEPVVTTNGCFDIMHAGHIMFLRDAAHLRRKQKLVVALNTDASVSMLKGVDRPLMSLEDRMQAVDALPFVDFVTAFVEPDPCEFLRSIRPDYHVKGEEYELKPDTEVPERGVCKDLGITMRYIPPAISVSTTRIIQAWLDRTGRR